MGPAWCCTHHIWVVRSSRLTIASQTNLVSMQSESNTQAKQKPLNKGATKKKYTWWCTTTKDVDQDQDQDKKMKQPRENKKNQTFNKIIFSFVVRFGSLFCRWKIPKWLFLENKAPGDFHLKANRDERYPFAFILCIHFDGSFILLLILSFCTYQHFTSICARVPACVLVCLCAVVMYFSFFMNIHIGCCFGFGSCLCMCVRARSTCKCVSFTATRHISSTQRFAAMKNKLLSNGLLFMFTFYMKMFKIKRNRKKEHKHTKKRILMSLRLLLYLVGNC